MIFDFDQFADITSRVFPRGLYSLNEALFVFRCYFEAYEEHTGRPHPPIKASQIVSIVQDMPYLAIEDFGAYSATVRPMDYPAIIKRHFRTKYRRCDWNINHFFSGRIREMRFLELCRMDD